MKRRYINYLISASLGGIIGEAFFNAIILKMNYITLVFAIIAFVLHTYSNYKDAMEREQNK